MKKVKTKYGYTVVFNKPFFNSDIEIYNEDGRLTCALTAKDVEKLYNVTKKLIFYEIK